MHSRKVWLLAATMAAACSSSPAPGDIGGGTPRGDAGANDDAGNPAGHDASSESGQDGATVDGGPGADADGGPGTDGGSAEGGEAGPPPGAPVCDPTHVWTAVAGIDPAIPSAGFGQFGAVSRDELTVAWTTSAGAIQVADRSARNMPFNSPTTVTAGSTALAIDRVALDWTGTLILAISSDRKQMVEITRQAGTTTWTVAAPSDLVNINALASNGGGLSEPVLGMDGNTLVFLWTPTQQAPQMIASTWDAQQKVWSAGVTLTNPELGSTDSTHRRRPTGVSSDGRTLFLYDESQGKERAAWRDSITSSFTQFVDVGTIPEAAPNYLCNRLYFQGADQEAGGAGLGFAH